MSNQRKFLEGELRFVEGQVSVDNFLQGISNELVKTGWTDYTQRGVDTPWTFDMNREIHLPDSFPKDDIQIYKTMGFSNTLPSGLSTGRLKVIQGVTSIDNTSLLLSLNGDNYNINLSMGDSPEDVAESILNVVKTIDNFKESYIEEDGVTLIIVGSEFPVYSLTTNTQIPESAEKGLITFTSIDEGVANGTIRILSDAMRDGEITITLNEETISLNVSEGQSSQQIARNIRDRILSSTEFHNTNAVENVVTVSGSESVIELSSTTDEERVTNTISEVGGGFATIEVLSEARNSGEIVIELNSIERIVPIDRGDSSVAIAQKIQNYLSTISGFTMTNVSDNIVTVSGSTTVLNIELSTDIETIPTVFTSSEANESQDVGIIELSTTPKSSHTLQITINGRSFNVSILSSDSIQVSAEKIRQAIAKDSGFTATYVEDNRVIANGTEEVFSIEVSNDLSNDRIHTYSKVETGGDQIGELNIIRPMAEDDSLTITVNEENFMVSLSKGDSPQDIAEKIVDVFQETEDFAESYFDDSTVYIAGDASVDSLFISPLIIPPEDYNVVNNVITGIGDANSGTEVGDNINIKVVFTGEDFQQVCFLPSQQDVEKKRNLAKLKSRPKGDITLYKNTVFSIRGEVLQTRGDGLFFTFGRSPISQTKGEDEVVIRKGKNESELAEVPKDKYTIDFYNGVLIFKEPVDEEDIVVADYGFLNNLPKEKIDSDKYRVLNDVLIDMTPDGELENQEVVVKVNYFWDIVYPSSLAEITSETDRIVLKTKIDTTSLKNKTQLKNYYWELRQVRSDATGYLTGIECRFGASLDGSRTTLDNNTASEWARWAWYDKKGYETNNLTFQEWLPVHYQMNFTQEYMNIVVQGSPSVDVNPYDNYLISYAYVGALENYKGAKNEDAQYNFAMTVGSDQLYDEGAFPSEWGQRTATCITDIGMDRTGDGIPHQAHYPSFHTSPEFMEKHFIKESDYTGSYHFSEIVATHPVQRERGKMQGVLVGDRSAIHHLDNLISNKDEFNNNGVLLNEEGEYLNACGKPNESKEKKWVTFNVNSPYWFMNNSPNTLFGIAIRKS